MSFRPYFYPLFMKDLNRPWEKVIHLGTPVSFPAKAVITGRKHGTEQSGVYYVKRGRVRLSNVTIGGQEKMLLYMGEGSLFNEIPMLTSSSDYMFTCLENTETIFWTRKQITEFIKEYPELVLNLMEAMGTKMQNFYVQLCGMSSYGAFVNVCRVLFSMHLFQRKGDIVVPGISKQELAAFLGIHRSSLHKALARLQDEGVIGAYTRNYLEITNLEALKTYAEQLVEL